MSRRLSSVLASVPGGVRYRAPEVGTPAWLLIPASLHETWKDGPAGGLSDREVADLLWGGYAVFAGIRIQDDLLDRARDDLRLLFVADRLLLESLESFQRFPALDETFWTFYRCCLRETADAILEVRRLEEAPGRFTAEHLRLHARVSAIFKLSTAAMCQLYGRAEEIGRLSDLLETLAIFSQICDDLRDLADDLRVGRFTWVANAVFGGESGVSIVGNELAGRLGQTFMRAGWAEPVLAELRRLARQAGETVPISAPPLLHELVGGLPARPDAIEQSFHEARVRSVFGDLVATGR